MTLEEAFLTAYNELTKEEIKEWIREQWPKKALAPEEDMLKLHLDPFLTGCQKHSVRRSCE
ncbi:hypothetical protein E2562_007419 [Oryza meyeriana var. granulata]|uniref:Uncharacterized protein n=1 Tax=Oryza meyeriana var. granulata TaxID=110450 RepID=A0A6G1CZN9_9ORYZ|nr:hypothetical protein E2562_007419 [Oryza meyeriana var. granulata]